MKMYIQIALSLMCMAAMTVECCVLKRVRGLTAERLEPVTIVGTMGNTVKLLGFLESPAQPFYKDKQTVYVGEHIYEVTKTSAGYQVNIRFLTCTDEGMYTIGSETFNLRAESDTCGMFYYSHKVDKVNKAAFVSPLDGVIRISMLHVYPNNQMWSVTEVWNNTMSRTISPAQCCFMIHNGNTFGGYGDIFYQYFMSQRRGQAKASCANAQLTTAAVSPTATTTRVPTIVVPDLKKLEDVKTSVKLLNVSDSLSDLNRMIEKFSRNKNSASTLQARSILTPFIITMTTLMIAT